MTRMREGKKNLGEAWVVRLTAGSKEGDEKRKKRFR